jgi:AcrR family transcriptional regulator
VSNPYPNPPTRDRGRQALLAAALDLFTQKGYDSTSVEDLRQAAGFKSKASLYAHFSSKEAVSEALTAQIFEQIEHIILQAYSNAGTDPFAILTTALKSFIGWGLTHHQEYSFRFIRNQQDKLLSGQFDYAKNQLSEAYLKSLELLQQLRQHHPVRAIADAALISMVLGLISRAVIDQDSFGDIALDDKINQIFELCMCIIFSETVTS